MTGELRTPGVVVLDWTEKRTGNDLHWELTGKSLGQLKMLVESTISITASKETKENDGESDGERAGQRTIEATGIIREIEPDYLFIKVLDGTATYSDGSSVPVAQGGEHFYFHHQGATSSFQIVSFVAEGQTYQLANPAEQPQRRGFGFFGKH